MSGIVGQVNRDDAPADVDLVRRLTEYLAFRGPDAQVTWSDGPAALGHSLLRITPDTVDERQPCTLDGRAWITAEARLDDRASLLRRLTDRGMSLPDEVSDARLVLAAYHAWGESCLDYLVGDFAFAIWEMDSRRLFCARDRFGVRPFFYAHLGQSLFFSNTLACLRRIRGVGKKLDETWLGDWLLVDHCGDPSRTIFADIQRLRAAHCLTWGSSGLHVRRYWALPTEHPQLHLGSEQEYVDEFRRLLTLSLRDRLRLPAASVFMSGGLDSTTVAAMANAFLKRQFGRSDLCSFTMAFERLINDEEHRLGPHAAKAIGIPSQLVTLDDCRPYCEWEPGKPLSPADREEVMRRSGTQSEPSNSPLSHVAIRMHRQAAAQARIGLTGHGADPGLAWPNAYFFRLLRQGRWFSCFRDLCAYRKRFGRLPGLGIRSRLFPKGASYFKKAFPEWLNPNFADRLGLAQRICELSTPYDFRHASRPEAHAFIARDASWSNIFETIDAGVTGVPISMSHPLFDLRIINFFLSLPPFPFCVEKEILRQATVGLLPDEIRLRPKTPFGVDANALAFQQLDRASRSSYTLPDELDPYIRREAVGSLNELSKEWPWVNYRPFSFAYWIYQQSY